MYSFPFESCFPKSWDKKVVETFAFKIKKF